MPEHPVHTAPPDDPADVRPGRADPEAGQATAEYALVLLGAAAVALLLVAWATQTGAVGRLLDAVLDSILERI
jgi:hypothetical protein